MYWIFLRGELASEKLLRHQYVVVLWRDVETGFVVWIEFPTNWKLVRWIGLSSGAMDVIGLNTREKRDQLGKIFLSLIGLSVPFYWFVPMMIKKNVKNLNKNATFKTTKNYEFRRKPNAWKQTNCHATLEQYFFQEMNLMPIIIQLGKTMKVTKYINRIIHIIRACWLFFPTPSPICCWISMRNSN